MGERHLIVDVYEGDLHGKPDWPVLVRQPEFVGAIIKATEGTGYGPEWFTRNWRALRDVAPDRYGDTWFRGAYHFLKFNIDGVEQADFYLSRINAAGGFDGGDIIPVVDVELGAEGGKTAAGRDVPRNSNWDASAQQIIDCTSAWVQRVKDETGQQVMLYGNGAMRDKGITSRMGCDWIWVPRYTSTLPRAVYERAGWDLASLALWQYCGDGVAALPDYPRSIPGFGAPDISVVTLDSLASFRDGLCGQATPST